MRYVRLCLSVALVFTSASVARACDAFGGPVTQTANIVIGHPGTITVTETSTDGVNNATTTYTAFDPSTRTSGTSWDMGQAHGCVEINFGGTPGFITTVAVTGHADDFSWAITGQTRYQGRGNDGVGDTVLEASITCSGAYAPPTHLLTFSGEVIANGCAGVHHMTLKVNGVVVGSTATPGGGGPAQSSSVSFTSADDLSGEAFTWFVDGLEQTSGTISYTCSGDPSICSFSDSITSDVSCHSTTPTPTPSFTATPPPTTPTPTAFPTPVPVGTPGSIIPVVPPGGGPPVNAQGVVVLNPQDIYNSIVNAVNGLPKTADIYDAVKAGVSDSGGGGPQAGVLPEDWQTPDAVVAERGHMDDVQAQVDSVTNDADSTRDGMTGKLAVFSASIATLPTSFGTVTSLPIDLSGFFHGSGPTSISLSTWTGPISLIRSLIGWCVTIGFFWLSLGAFTFED